MTWLVAISLIGKQPEALDNLKAQGFETYRPLYREKRYSRGRKIWRTASLFGRYFFVYYRQAWQAILNTRGVDDLLRVDERPLGVGDGEISEIKAREDHRGYIVIIKGFRPGQRVRVKHGLMTGAIGSFVELTAHDREIALFELLGQATRVEFAPGVLAAVA